MPVRQPSQICSRAHFYHKSAKKTSLYSTFLGSENFIWTISKLATYNFRRQEDHNCKGLQTKKKKGSSLSLSTRVICSPVFRVISFDIDNSICIILFYKPQNRRTRHMCVMLKAQFPNVARKSVNHCMALFHSKARRHNIIL